MKNNMKGFTLIEVIISLAIISIALVSFVSLFGQSLLLTDRGSNITQETFDHQEFMENEIVTIKEGFVNGTITEDDTISIFSGNYQSDVDVKVITEDIRGNRKFQTLVSNVEVLTPALPDVTLNVGVYADADSSIEVFPWYDDNIVIRADYTLNDDPVIFNNRIRWYQSQEDIVNPSFQSEYDIIYDEAEEEPFLDVPEESLLTTDNALDYYSISNRFYNFELRAYTLAGRLGYFMNQDRILVLPREGTSQWQAFVEDIYPKTAINTSIIFDNLTSDVFAEVMQNPERPTLNTDWIENVDSEGAQVAMMVPTDNFRTDVKFKVDSEALSNDFDTHGFGFLLGDNTNTGLIMNFDVANNLINLREVSNATYESDILSSINLLTNSAFENFRSTIDGEVVFNWDQEYNLTLSYLYDDLIIRLEYEDDGGNINQSDSTILANLGSGYNYDYFGFKSYSTVDYIPQERHEILNKYDRNYSAHFYDISVPLNVNLTSDGIWTNGGSHTIDTNNPMNDGVAYDDELVLKAFRFDTQNSQDLKLTSNKDVQFFAQIFFFQDGILEIKNKSTLRLNANQIVFNPEIDLEDGVSTMILNVIDVVSLYDSDNDVTISVPENFRAVLVDGDTIGGVSGTMYGEIYFSENVYDENDVAIISSGYYRFPDGFDFQEDWNKAADEGGLIPQSGGLIPVY